MNKNSVISGIALTYAILVYLALFGSFVSYGMIFPDNPTGWFIFVTGAIIAPIIYKYFANKKKKEWWDHRDRFTGPISPS